MKEATISTVAPPAARPSRSAARLERAAPAPDAAGRALLALIALGAVAAVGLWYANTPATLWGLAEWLTNAGRICGLLGGYGVAILLLLMARIPALEHTLGADRLARWHASGGRYTVCVLSAHAVLILWGYALAAHRGVAQQGWTLLRSYPDVLIATVGFLLLVAAGVTSARAARRRLSYEVWYAVHLLTYLAIALSFAHQFAVGAQFASSAPARWAWAALYLGAAGCVVWFRILGGIRSGLRHRLTVSAVRPEGPGIVSLLLTGERLEDLATRPGQFLRLRFLTREGWWQSHPYSLSAAAVPTALRVTVKALGDHSRLLQHVAPGTRVLAEGPYGALTADRRRHRKVLLLAGGIGITPLRALFATMEADPGDLTLVYRASRPDDIVFREELDAIARRRGAVVHYLAGPRGGYTDPLLPGRLGKLVRDLPAHDVFVCGPDGMTEAAVAALRSAGVPRGQIHTESFVL